jgi:2-dehydro-3-deoxygluconokinase
VSRPYVVTLGETMGLVYTTEPAPLAQAASARLGVGGAESNVAIALRRLGTESVWIGRRGADAWGERVERELRAEGVSVVATVDAEAPTGLMMRERRTATATRVWYYRAGSAGSRLSPDDIPHGVIEGAAVLHVTGITPALSATASSAVAEAVARASAAAVPVSFDVNHRSRLWRDSPKDVFTSLARRSDVVFAGLDEARLLVAGENPSAAARQIAALGPRQVVIKLGVDGCLALIDGVEYVVPAVPITVVDTVGAGDAFVAGYLAELVNGLSPLSRLDLAVRAAGFACETVGDWEGVPFRHELSLLGASEPVTR